MADSMIVILLGKSNLIVERGSLVLSRRRVTSCEQFVVLELCHKSLEQKRLW